MRPHNASPNHGSAYTTCPVTVKLETGIPQAIPLLDRGIQNRTSESALPPGPVIPDFDPGPSIFFVNGSCRSVRTFLEEVSRTTRAQPVSATGTVA
ncbi:hypothetical protein HOF92_14560 [bacterium]|nr:hypothetical protein [bacterium]